MASWQSADAAVIYSRTKKVVSLFATNTLMSSPAESRPASRTCIVSGNNSYNFRTTQKEIFPSMRSFTKSPWKAFFHDRLQTQGMPLYPQNVAPENQIVFLLQSFQMPDTRECHIRQYANPWVNCERWVPVLWHTLFCFFCYKCLFPVQSRHTQGSSKKKDSTHDKKGYSTSCHIA